MNGANILTYLMQDTTYDDDFLLGAARTLDGFERMAQDGPLTAQDWYNHNGHGPLPTKDEYDGWYDDPMSRHERRYFDGTEWTEHVANGETQASDPLEQPTTPCAQLLS